MTTDDYIFVTLYMLPQLNYDLEYCKKLFLLLKQTKTKIVVDLVPHTLFKNIKLNDLNYIIGYKVYAIIAETRTYLGLLNNNFVLHEYENHHKTIANNYNAEYYITRHGKANIEFQTIFHIDNKNKIQYIEKNRKTEYLKQTSENKRGYGDILTAHTINFLKQYKNEISSFIRKTTKI